MRDSAICGAPPAAPVPNSPELPKSRKPIATRKNSSLRRILGHLGTWGCQVRHLKDEHEARQVACAVFNVPNGTSLAGLADAIDLLGNRERRERACRNIQEKVPGGTPLWPKDARARLGKPTNKGPALKRGASATIAAHRAAIAKAKPLPRREVVAGVVDHKALAVEARQLPHAR